MLANRRLAEADAILSTWSGLVDRGMLPNRFGESGAAAEYNTVDAPLWFVVAVEEFLNAASHAGLRATGTKRGWRRPCRRSSKALLRGTRYGIALDADGLVRAGEPGLQLTWMDAKIGGRVVTPRIGKPVEIQALWINALRIAGRWSSRWAATERAARKRLSARDFPIREMAACSMSSTSIIARQRTTPRSAPTRSSPSAACRYPVLEGDLARKVVDLVERTLLTPLGLRSLAPDDAGLRPALSRRSGRARCRLSSRHRLALAHWSVRRSVAACARAKPRRPKPRHARASCRPC